jgi:hypothetical protein
MFRPTLPPFHQLNSPIDFSEMFSPAPLPRFQITPAIHQLPHEAGLLNLPAKIPQGLVEISMMDYD